MYVLSFIIGVIVAYMGMDIQSDISSAHCSKVLQKANTGVIVLATIMLTATLVLSYCNFTCKACPGPKKSETMTDSLVAMYYGFMLVLSIVLTTLGALMRKHAKDTSTPCPKVEKKANIIMGLGITGIVVMIGPFVAKLAYHGGTKAYHGAHRAYTRNQRSKAANSESAGVEMVSAMCGSKRSEA